MRWPAFGLGFRMTFLPRVGTGSRPPMITGMKDSSRRGRTPCFSQKAEHWLFSGAGVGEQPLPIIKC